MALDRQEYDRIMAGVRGIQSGRLLVSDRLANHLDDLVELVEAFPWRPPDLKEALQLAPEQTRDWLDRVAELKYIVAQVEEDQGSAPIFDVGKPQVV
jgi:hypothetical protein